MEQKSNNRECVMAWIVIRRSEKDAILELLKCMNTNGASVIVYNLTVFNDLIDDEILEIIRKTQWADGSPRAYAIVN